MVLQDTETRGEDSKITLSAEGAVSMMENAIARAICIMGDLRRVAEEFVMRGSTVTKKKRQFQVADCSAVRL